MTANFVEHEAAQLHGLEPPGERLGRLRGERKLGETVFFDGAVRRAEAALQMPGFSSRFDPPAPVLPVRLRARAGEAWERHHALVDTGSDICGVPRPVVELLDLAPVRIARVAGVLGQSETVVFRLDIEVEGRLFSKVEALAIDRPYVLLGRNVQRKLWLGLDGPRGRLEVR